MPVIYVPENIVLNQDTRNKVSNQLDNMVILWKKKDNDMAKLLDELRDSLGKMEAANVALGKREVKASDGSFDDNARELNEKRANAQQVYAAWQVYREAIQVASFLQSEKKPSAAVMDEVRLLNSAIKTSVQLVQPGGTVTENDLKVATTVADTMKEMLKGDRASAIRKKVWGGLLIALGSLVIACAFVMMIALPLSNVGLAAALVATLATMGAGMGLLMGGIQMKSRADRESVLHKTRSMFHENLKERIAAKLPKKEDAPGLGDGDKPAKR